MKGSMLSTISSRALLAACEYRGLDTAQLLRDVGLESSLVQDAEARMPGEKVAALWRLAIERTGDAEIAFLAVELLPFGAYRVFDFLAMNSATVGQAMKRVSHFFPLLHSTAELPVEIHSEWASLAITNPRDPSGMPRAYVLYIMSAIFRRCRRAIGVEFPLARVEFAFPGPKDLSGYAAAFECETVFDARQSRMVFDRSVWDAEVSRANIDLAGVLEEYAEMLLSQLPKGEGIVGQVREAIHPELGGGDPTLEHVASKLAMSPRTLQRKLKEANVTYAEILDEMRTGMARAYLKRRDVSIAEVAYLLGFAEQSSFSRAFKRWTGSTPGEFRQHAVA